MKRLAVLVAALAIVAVAIGVADVLRSRPAPVDPQPRRVVRIERPTDVRMGSDPGRTSVAAPPARSPAEAAFTQRVDTVARECGLDGEVACGEAGCAVLLEMPDLDGPVAWLGMLATHRRFVASTALRDLGVPARVLPCGDAIATLNGGRGAMLVERADGSEVWCAPDAASWGDATRAHCDAAAAALGLGATGFGRPGSRTLVFRRE